MFCEYGRMLVFCGLFCHRYSNDTLCCSRIVLTTGTLSSPSFSALLFPPLPFPCKMGYAGAIWTTLFRHKNANLYCLQDILKRLNCSWGIFGIKTRQKFPTVTCLQNITKKTELAIRLAKMPFSVLNLKADICQNTCTAARMLYPERRLVTERRPHVEISTVYVPRYVE